MQRTSRAKQTGEALRITKHRHTKYKMMRKYGITWDEFHAMLVAQSGRCGICSRPMYNPIIDHCHESDRVRELLCNNCNAGLGMFEDNLEFIRAAYRYVKRHRP